MRFLKSQFNHLFFEYFFEFFVIEVNAQNLIAGNPAVKAAKHSTAGQFNGNICLIPALFRFHLFVADFDGVVKLLFHHFAGQGVISANWFDMCKEPRWYCQYHQQYQTFSGDISRF